jgi:hypothetical protein
VLPLVAVQPTAPDDGIHSINLVGEKLQLLAPLVHPHPRRRGGGVAAGGKGAAQSPDLWASRVRGFRQGLSEIGYVDGRNVAIEYRWAEAPKRSIAYAGVRSRSSSGGGDRCG